MCFFQCARVSLVKSDSEKFEQSWKSHIKQKQKYWQFAFNLDDHGSDDSNGGGSDGDGSGSNTPWQSDGDFMNDNFNLTVKKNKFNFTSANQRI